MNSGNPSGLCLWEVAKPSSRRREEADFQSKGLVRLLTSAATARDRHQAQGHSCAREKRRGKLVAARTRYAAAPVVCWTAASPIQLVRALEAWTWQERLGSLVSRRGRAR